MPSNHRQFKIRFFTNNIKKRGVFLLIKNARIIDPCAKIDTIGDILIENGKIADIGHFEASSDGDILDANGLVAAPGLVDMHVHFRDPGFTHKEDILSGAAAAAAGGFTAVACMPNTSPVIDSPDSVKYVLDKGLQTAINILPIAAVTKGQKGCELTDALALKNSGAVALSDDGVPVDRAIIVRAAMFVAKEAGLPIISHCEDREMVQNFAANEGDISRQLNLPGRPSIAEELMVARDILLAGETGAQLHIAHVSTRGSVELIGLAKQSGINVTAETCPQYFTITDQELLKKGSLARVNPPLRRVEDVQSITEAVCQGVIDTIVTDHAPHSSEEKSLPLSNAPSGMIGLETSLALTLTMLYHTGKMSLMDIINRMSTAPRVILGLNAGMTKDSPADITLFDPDEVWTVDPEKFHSKARNTPFGGMELRGRAKYTIVNGKIAFGG